MNDARTALNENQKARDVKSYYQGKETPDFMFNSPFIGAGGIYSSGKDMLKYIDVTANAVNEIFPDRSQKV